MRIGPTALPSLRILPKFFSWILCADKARSRGMLQQHLAALLHFANDKFRCVNPMNRKSFAARCHPPLDIEFILTISMGRTEMAHHLSWFNRSATLVKGRARKQPDGCLAGPVNKLHSSWSNRSATLVKGRERKQPDGYLAGPVNMVQRSLR